MTKLDDIRPEVAALPVGSKVSYRDPNTGDYKVGTIAEKDVKLAGGVSPCTIFVMVEDPSTFIYADECRKA